MIEIHIFLKLKKKNSHFLLKLSIIKLFYHCILFDIVELFLKLKAVKIF